MCACAHTRAHTRAPKAHTHTGVRACACVCARARARARAHAHAYTHTHTHTHTHIHTRTHIHTHTHTGATYLVPAHKSKTDEGADGVILQSTMNLPTDKAGDVMKLHLYLSACSKRDGDDSITRHLRRGEVVELPGANDPVIYVHKIKFTCNSTSHLLTTQMHVSDYVRHGHCLS